MAIDGPRPKNTGVETPEKIDSFEGALNALKTVVSPDSDNKERLEALKALTELAKEVFGAKKNDLQPAHPQTPQFTSTPNPSPSSTSAPTLTSTPATLHSAPPSTPAPNVMTDGQAQLNQRNNFSKSDEEVLKGDFKNVLCAGSSSLNMMARFCENIINLSQGSAPSGTILNNLKTHPEKFKGVDTLIAQYGLNNNYNPDQVVRDLMETIHLARGQSVTKIVVLSGFPFDHRLRGQKKSFVERGIELKDQLKKEFDHPQINGIQIEFIDFYELYAYKEGDALPQGYQVGDLRVEYEKEKPSDLIHPPRALAQKGMAHVLRLV